MYKWNTLFKTIKLLLKTHIFYSLFTWSAEPRYQFWWARYPASEFCVHFSFLAYICRCILSLECTYLLVCLFIYFITKVSIIALYQYKFIVYNYINIATYKWHKMELISRPKINQSKFPSRIFVITKTLAYTSCFCYFYKLIIAYVFISYLTYILYQKHGVYAGFTYK